MRPLDHAKVRRLKRLKEVSASASMELAFGKRPKDPGTGLTLAELVKELQDEYLKQAKVQRGLPEDEQEDLSVYMTLIDDIVDALA